MVIGLTPPGTRVMKPATVLASSNATSPTNRVDNRCAGLDPVAPDHFRPVHGGDQDIGLAAALSQVLRTRMGDSDGAVLGQQQRRHRLADDVGTAEHQGTLALQFPKRFLQHQ